MIAVIGISCLLPGANNCKQYWQNLLDGKNAKSTASFNELGVDPGAYWAEKKGTTDKSYCMEGGFVHDFQFDPGGYALSSDYLTSLDDLHKWVLHVSREALKDSGYEGKTEALKNCGVVLGNLSFPTRMSNRLCLPLYHTVLEESIRKNKGLENFKLPPYAPPVEGAVSVDNMMISGFPAGLVAQAMELKGTSLALDAACSSSIYSMKVACDYLMNGKADMMLAGAVSCADPFFISMGFSIFQAYPNIPESSPLDSSSRGLIAGEGAGMFVLKRLEDALRDGDNIHSVIRGVGLSNDGRGQSVLSPSSDGQNLAFERAYEKANVPPGEISFIECHATGTPLGDKVELDSMDIFFGKHGASPHVGSSKSNVGHLLTAAGMSGMIKTIMAMKHGLLPGTIGIREPQSSKNNVISQRQIPTKTIPWPESRIQGVRNAAVSGFGFGGTNAHIVFEHRDDYSKMIGGAKQGESAAKVINLFEEKKNRGDSSDSSMVITGMDALFGSSGDITEFHRTVYEGLQLFRKLPEERWKGMEKCESLLKQYGFKDGKAPLGAYVDQFDIDFLGFRIPPNKEDRLIPQQLITLKVADRALKDAGIKEGTNTGVLVAMGSELSLHQFRGRVNLTTQLDEGFAEGYPGLSPEEIKTLKDNIKLGVHGIAQVNQYTSFIGNIMASRISSVWDFSGPSHSISSEENSVFKALEVARMMLDSREVDAVVVAAVDLAGGMENILLRNLKTPLNTGAPTMGFDAGVNGWMVGEGAGALVLKRRDDALKDKDRIYATVNSLAFVQGTDEDAVARASEKAAKEAGISLSDVGYLEVFASGIESQDRAEIAGLTRTYGGQDETLKCAIGSVKANIGHTFAASGMAGLIKTALCLFNRFIPATPGWTGPKYLKKWQESPFFVPTSSRTWFDDGQRDVRVAALSGLGADGTCAHLILSDEPGQERRNNDYLAQMPLSMFPITGNTELEIQQGLDSLAKALEADAILPKVASAFHRKFLESQNSTYRAAIIGMKRREVFDEIDLARKEIPEAFKNNADWRSDTGSFFTARPMGDKAKVAFVYPGGLNSYVAMGRNLFQLFPELYDKAGNYTSRMGDVVGCDLINPRSMVSQSREKGDDLGDKLFNSPSAMFESGMMSSVLYTDIIRDSFKISPDQALGYSMGEVSMLFALGVWDDMDSLQDKFNDSPLIKKRLRGSVEDLIGPFATNGSKGKIWYSYSLNATPDAVRRALARDSEISKGRAAYLIFVNTPNEVVIAGYDQACKRVIQELKCSYFEVPVSDVIHSELVKNDYEELLKIHRLPVKKVENIDFYSAFNFAPIVLDSDRVARNIADIYSHEIDFQKLVETSHAEGGRIFIELGPRDNCTGWIREILSGKDHLAVSVGRKDSDENLSIMQALAQLFCHQLEMDISPLFIDEGLKQVSKRLLVKSIKLGGADLDAQVNSRENQALFNKMTGPSATVAKPKNTKNQEERSTVLNTQANTDIPENGKVSELDLFGKNISLLSRAHDAFLDNRHQGAAQLKELIEHQIVMAGAGGKGSAAPVLAPAPKPTVIWDHGDLLEFAEGRIANVFGDEYAIIDTYSRRVRLPMEDYLLVTRVTELEAVRGEFKPSTMTTEYYISMDSPLTIDGQIPWAVSVESGQCDLLLISYLGIDFQCKGERVYRLLDCTLTFMEDIAMEGETLRYDISINSFAKSGESLLFFFSYRCFVEDRLVLKMDGGCAGFFTEEELDAGKGIVYMEEDLRKRSEIKKQTFTPFLTCPKTCFEREELLAIIQGNRAACFGEAYGQGGLNPSLRFASEKMLMIDRIPLVDLQGGPWGLGSVTGGKILDPEHWYFPCHFKDDQVMAGSLMAEGCGQLLQFFLLYIGMHTRTKDARFQPIPDLPQKVRCRGQVVPQHGVLKYRLEITKIGLDPHPYAIANIDILLNDRIVVDFKDLGVQLVEKPDGDKYKLDPSLIELAPMEVAQQKPVGKTRDEIALYNQFHMVHFATGTISECFGPEFKIYDNRVAPRTPNGDLQLTTRVMEVEGERHNFKKPAFCVAEYDVPEDAWYYTNNAHEGVMPYSVIMEIALQPCGFISACMGTTLLAPDTDFYFRNLDGAGHLHQDLDLRGKTIVNTSTLLSTVFMGNTIIQSFTFEMTVDGMAYYSGTAVFGYFVASALTDQVGLDKGIDNHPLTEQKYLKNMAVDDIDLQDAHVRERYYQGSEAKPFYRLCGPQLDFLTKVRIVPNGGENGLGYIYADRPIDETDWFFKCHFFQDPVMPGSLGVESVMQALQVFALHQDLGAGFDCPRFTQIEENIAWKYRGQINPDIDAMSIEVHITKVEKSDDKVTVVGAASLWKDRIRIYEVTDIAIVIEEGTPVS
jgi:PfaB family protein